MTLLWSVLRLPIYADPTAAAFRSGSSWHFVVDERTVDSVRGDLRFCATAGKAGGALSGPGKCLVWRRAASGGASLLHFLCVVAESRLGATSQGRREDGKAENDHGFDRGESGIFSRFSREKRP
jgi:hypothetical protein